ncbi:MAG: methyltransferase domain-containing protein [Proteobacteria bacterium]|nr:methyltransferase domain-containing protein [Pseudomonadota bacterium]
MNRYTAKRLVGDTLFARIGRAVCEAECLPRKEFYEAWEVAKRVRRLMRGGDVKEMAAGHGLLSAMLIILDDTTPTATCVDIKQPQSHRKIMEVLEQRWPRLKGRVRYEEKSIENIPISSEALTISVHACGILTDRVISAAIDGHSRVAVLPCCHDLKLCDTGSLKGWMDGPLAVDATRVARLKSAGYRVATLSIPKDITPKNRLLLGWPDTGHPVDN